MDSPVDYAGPAACGGPFARLTLNSPHNRNALSSTLVSQLHQGLSAAEADPAVRLVVLGHTGGTFCAGADLSEAGGGGGDPYRMAVARAREMTALLRAIVESPLPVVGAINGHVRAGGFGLVGACDMVVAGPESTFALTEARIGVAPAIISLTLLPKLSPRAAARYYLTGEKFGAREAADIGLITMAAHVGDQRGHRLRRRRLGTAYSELPCGSDTQAANCLRPETAWRRTTSPYRPPSSLGLCCPATWTGSPPAAAP